MSMQARAWRTSSYSSNGASCVEVAPLGGGTTGVRDTKDRTRGHLAVPGSSWTPLLDALRRRYP